MVERNFSLLRLFECIRCGLLIIRLVGSWLIIISCFGVFDNVLIVIIIVSCVLIGIVERLMMLLFRL